ncbi:AI-2E family transporter [Vandammella animalimorsus]|uniref:Phytochrome sensor protein n=1 Tax=Vandammella animalimorsus TaxID=2029117 RepID=A0A2A2B1D5_9BURK|nr:AI-2E family transporter [Vandammella animalimorsus]PAT43976.1 phytochrome sensor protein [Vandammella animalimorsus]
MSEKPVSSPTGAPSAQPHRPAEVLRHGDVPEQAALAQLTALVPGLRAATVLVIGAVVICALYFGRELLIPLALAILLGFLLDPLVRRLKRWGLPRMVAIVLVVAVVLGGLGGLGAYLGQQLAALGESLPRYQATMSEKLRGLSASVEGAGMFDRLTSALQDLHRDIAGQGAEPASGQPGGAAQAAPEQTVQQVQVVPAPPTNVQLAQTWLLRISEPLLMAGIVILFVVLILLDRDALRDRLLRLMGGNLNMATEALDDASQRIGKYLRMQLIVNITYGVPLAVGLWLIGVPGALLWGVVAALMRYVPYAGPALAAIFPVALAFAVEPGWSMLIWTVALILALELISNNIVEPWLYGESTGLSTLAIIVSATFWTALWGPIGLILATPLSVCLLVLGRTIPALHFLEVLLGSEPVLTPAQRLYQRLLVEDVETALEISQQTIEDSMPRSADDEQDLPLALVQYYDSVLLPSLRLSSHLHSSMATAEQRFRFDNGMDGLLDELADEYPPPVHTLAPEGEVAAVHCLGSRWEVDAMAAAALAHGLRLYGHTASVSTHALGARVDLASLPQLDTCQVLCLVAFSPQPQAQIRHISRRIRRRWPHVRIIACVFNAPGLELTSQMAQRLSADELVNRMHEVVLSVNSQFADGAALEYIPAAIPEDETRRLRALQQSDMLAEDKLALYRDTVRRATNAFAVKHAQISLVGEDWVHTPGSTLAEVDADPASTGLPRAQSVCSYVTRNGQPLVVEDVQHDPRFARNPALNEQGIRFYAGVPLRARRGEVIGTLCLMDDEPHDEEDVDLQLLELMAGELMGELRKLARRKPDAQPEPETPPEDGLDAPAPQAL